MRVRGCKWSTQKESVRKTPLLKTWPKKARRETGVRPLTYFVLPMEECTAGMEYCFETNLLRGDMMRLSRVGQFIIC